MSKIKIMQTGASSRSDSPHNNIEGSNDFQNSSNNKKRSISSFGKLKLNFKSASNIGSEDPESNNSASQVGCERCKDMKDSTLKCINNLKKYIDVINERINMFYHKINPMNKNISVSSSNADIDVLLSPEYYHTLYYSDLDKLKLNTDIANSMRILMKSIRLFSDHFEYINLNHENFERKIADFKKFKISSKNEDMSNLSNLNNFNEVELEEIKSLEVKNIFKNFNSSKDTMDGLLKEIRNQQNDHNKHIMKGSGTEYLDIVNQNQHDVYKENFLRNETYRLGKENTSLKMELNLLYEQLRDDNKIYEIKNDKSSSNKLDKDKKTNTYSNNPSSEINIKESPVIVIKVENDTNLETYYHAKNYINLLKQSEFIL